MKKFFEIIEEFERRANLLFFKIERFLHPNTKKVKRVKEKVTERIQHYEWLIEQYYLIADKKSTLSAKERASVIDSVNFLVSKGHITGTLPELPTNQNQSKLKVV